MYVKLKVITFETIFCYLQITEDDELTKAICHECQNGLEGVRSFFEGCFNANQELVIQYRKARGSSIDLSSHINQ